MNYVPLAAGIILDESASIQGDLYAGISSGKEATSQDYNVMPIWKDASYFDSPLKDVEDGTHNEDVDKDKSEDDSSPMEVNAAGQHVNTASLVDPSLNTAGGSNAGRTSAIQAPTGLDTCGFSFWKEGHWNKMVFKNKKDERGIMIRNKARLVAQGHVQEEGIDYE
nr:retrovirus-related Pol polyprotein from transposon TNT 1-94 [Tanacetum cinerariifolium]